jgi:hypothetical protein
VLLAACAPDRYRVDAGVTRLEASGDVALQNSAGTLNLDVDRNDLENDLGLGDAEVVPYVRGEVNWGRQRVELSGLGYRSSGSGVLASAFGDLPAGTAVATDLDFYAISGNWTYDLLPTDRFRLAPGAQLSYYGLDLNATSTVPAAFEEVRSNVLVPELYLAAEALLDSVVALEVGLGWMEADLGDGRGTYWDAQGLVRVRPQGNLEIFGGYRFLAIDVRGTADARDFDADLEFAGWMFGLGIRF